jgi:glycosyltransferase involved in cell wall biosynthesis
VTRIAFIVNGQAASPMGQRARAFATRLAARHEIETYYRDGRKLTAIGGFAARLWRFRPDVCYVLDMGYSGVAGAALYRSLRGRRLIIDTGDAITALARSLGRGRVGVALTALLERFGMHMADRLVVRGSYHQEWCARHGIAADFIPDGVEIAMFAPRPVPELRRRFDLDGSFTIGVMGSSVWNPRLETCYGDDLVELIYMLRESRVRGIMIGSGSGIPILQQRCRRYGIEERVHFVGHLPYEELPDYLSLFDVALSTQTNDLVGQVRTTGKLPLYLAAGRYVLASNVGEAACLLPPEMLVDFAGQADQTYPCKLAERVRGLMAEPERLERGRQLCELARTHFDYDILADRLEAIVDDVVHAAPRNRKSVAR